MEPFDNVTDDGPSPPLPSLLNKTKSNTKKKLSTTSTSSTSTWRDNSSKQKVEDHATKYNLHSTMPDDFVYTNEERGLLQMYDTVKTFEREVIRLRERKAREHIYAATATPTAGETKKAGDNSDNGPAAAVAGTKRRKKKRSVHAADATAVGMNDIDAMMSSSSDDDDDDDEYDSDNNTAEYKLNKLRDEIKEKKLAKLQEFDAREIEERMRNELLAKNDDGMDGMSSQPLLKRKKLGVDADGTTGGPSLLSTMMTAKTPPHEFSDKLELKPWKGKVLFPVSSPDDSDSDDEQDRKWVPAPNGYRPKNPNDGAFLVPLEDFDITKIDNNEGPNTLAIKFQAPIDSKRFSFNIAGPDHNDFDSILLHFNPRPREKGGQIVVNDKQKGMWGRAVNLPLSEAPLIFGQPSATIIVQINGDGFDIFVENKHVARLEHRVELPSRACSLYLQFPSCDDYRRPENWVVYKTWWGNKESMTKDDISNIAGVNAFDSVHKKKLFINGLKKIRTTQQVELRTAEMEREFGKYGGPRGVQTIVPKHSRYAFVEFETEQQCSMALERLKATYPYQLNRARRTKHEALTEERAEKESGGKSSGDW